MPPNLYTPADGLFGTHVTWEDCEEDMQRELDTMASFGANKTAKDIGDGNGFMSKMVLIDPDWQHKDKNLPSRFVVKILTQLAIQKVFTEMSEMNNVKNSVSDPKFMADMEEMQKVCHNAEVRTYKHLMKATKEGMRIPKIYYMKMFTESNPLKGYIIMEYIDNLRAVPIYENVPPRGVKQVLRHKAVMEAISLKMPIEERSGFTSPFQTVFKSMFEKEMLDHFMAMFAAFGGEKLAEKCEHVKAILSDMVDLEWVDNMAEEFGMERVLCHGDLHSNNILWRENGENYDMVAVIDYQIAHFGCAATDLVRLFSGCLSGIDRRAQWEQLLEDFYGYLREEVDDSRMPYTLEQLKEAYRQYFPLGAFMIVTVIGPFFELVCKSSDENLRKKGIDVVMEKTECLLDDIFFYHNRNMELRKNGKVA